MVLSEGRIQCVGRLSLPSGHLSDDCHYMSSLFGGARFIFTLLTALLIIYYSGSVADPT